MAGLKFLPHGTTVTFASADIGGIVDVTLPEESKGMAEQTDNDSGGSREYLPGLKDAGAFTVTVRRIPGDAGQQACRDNYDATPGVSQECVVTLPASATDDSTVATFTFDAFVVSPGGGSLPQDADETATFDIGFQVDGAVTEALA